MSVQVRFNAIAATMVLNLDNSEMASLAAAFAVSTAQCQG